MSLIIITIGASIFIRGIAGQAWGKNSVPLPPFSSGGSLSFLGAYIQLQSLWIIGATLVVMVALHLLLSYTMIGKALRACAINRRAASLIGINARAMSLISFCLAAALGAIGGIIIAPMTFTSYDVGVMLGLKGFVAAAIGGFTGQLATVIGGITLGIAESLGAGLISSAYKDAIALAILLLVLLVRSSRVEAMEGET